MGLLSDYGRGKSARPWRSSVARETEKLDLEIESLRKKNRRDIIRLVTIIVTVAGLLFGLYKFYAEQQKDRISREADQKLRFQNQMRADIDEILRFTQDKTETMSRASFLLEDLKTLLAMAPVSGDQRTFASYKESFTRSLVYLILYDSDFNKNPRDVRFAATVLDRWPDYQIYLQSHVGELNLILYKHVRAVRYLRDTNPRYLEDVRYYEPTNQYFVLPKYEKQEGEESLFQHFIYIRNGFQALTRLIAADPNSDAKKVRDQNLHDFEAALCNPEVAKQVLGTDYAKVPCEK